MRINCHAHLFNARSVFTSETLEILLRRITDMEIPEVIKKEIAAQLGNLYKKAGEFVDEETLFRTVVKKVSAADEFKKALKSLSSGDKLKLELAGGGVLEDYAVDALVTLLGRIGDALGEETKDAGKADLMDVVSFLRIALLPSIRHVTDTLMEQLTLQDAVVALTMDVTHDGKNARQFEQQLAETSAQVLAYPGRIFPFVAVNTKRPDHFSIMEMALVARGFVGVKLYPSLGCPVDSDEMTKVFAYCESRGVPIVMHCSEGGFYLSKETRCYCDPAHLGPVLEKHPKLRLCFAHMGGAKYLTTTTIGGWTRSILDLMDTYEGVHADISNHTESMNGGEKEKIYFANLSQLLSHPTYKSRILFGTDYFFSRQRLTEKNYWKYIRKHLDEEEFRQIAETNTATFLGLPTATAKMGLTIQNYVRFVYQQRDGLLSEPAEWLKVAIKELYGPSATLPKPSLGPKWSWNNKVHQHLFMFLAERQLSDVQKKRGFDGVGLMKLRDMAYWNKGFETKEIWEKKVVAMAQNFDTFCGANGGKYEENHAPPKAMAALMKIFDDGSKYVHEVGEACDAIYRF